MQAPLVHNGYSSRQHACRNEMGPHPDAGRFICAFVGTASCTHHELFGGQYQRANRTNSTKILRCFPHCCPRHVARSYCGSSLTAHVVSQDGEDPRGELEVYARFCPSDEHRYAVGTCVPVESVLSSLQSSSNTGGEWIPSQLAMRGEKAAWIFEVNPSRRWYYAWCSGKTNAQRYTAHKLEAIVVQRRRADQFQIVARTASTPFKITSFRRCLTSKDKPFSSRPLSVLEAALLQRVVQQGDRQIRLVELSVFAGPIPVDPPESFTRSAGLVFASVGAIPLGSVRQLLPSWRQHHPAPPALVVGLGASAVVANLVYWLTVDPLICATIARYAAHAADHLVDISVLLQCHELSLQRLRQRVERFLHDYGTTWRAIVAHAKELIRRSIGPSAQARPHPFDRESFGARVRATVVDSSRRRPTTLFAGNTFPDDRPIDGEWSCAFRSIQIVRGSKSITKSTKPHAAERSLDSFESLPTAAVIVLLQQLSDVRLCLDPQARELEIVSLSTLAMCERTGSRLILDGTCRCCSVLPNGGSAMSTGAVLGGQCFGDYIGTIGTDGSVQVTCFSWPSTQWLGQPHACSDDGYRWDWDLHVETETANSIIANLSVSRGAIRDRGGEAFACRRVDERVATVAAWTSVLCSQSTFVAREEARQAPAFGSTWGVKEITPKLAKSRKKDLR